MAAKCILIAIADKARHGRSVCTISYADIAELVRLKRRWTITHVQRLARGQWITIQAVRHEKYGDQPNHIRMGPRFQQAVKEQARQELAAARSALCTGSKWCPAPSPRTSVRPGCSPLHSRTQSPALPGCSPPHSRGAVCTHKDSYKDSYKDSLTSSSSSTPPLAKCDDDDVRFAPQNESGGSKQTATPLTDVEGLEMVGRVASKCIGCPVRRQSFRPRLNSATASSMTGDCWPRRSSGLTRKSPRAMPGQKTRLPTPWRCSRRCGRRFSGRRAGRVAHEGGPASEIRGTTDPGAAQDGVRGYSDPDRI